MKIMSTFFGCGPVKLQDNIYDELFLPQSTNGSLRSSFMFMLNLLWESRFRLPVLVLIGLILFDVRLQLELNGQDLVEQIRDANNENEDEEEYEYDDSSDDDFDDDDDDDDEEDINVIDDRIHEIYVSELRRELFNENLNRGSSRSGILDLFFNFRTQRRQLEPGVQIPQSPVLEPETDAVPVARLQ